MDVSIIGAGNVAWHLAIALDNAGYAVKEVFSRNARNATAVVERLYAATAKTDLDFSDSRSRIFIIAVTDDAMTEVVQDLILPEDAILVHTSGSRPMSILEQSAKNIGVLYPLQTFTKSKKVDFSEVPMFIEASDKTGQGILMNMAKAISNKVFNITSDDRKAIHVAAVFASNFTNHMLSIAQGILSRRGLDFQMLKPLIAETVNKSLTLGPRATQTGPARRGDLEILDIHMEFLKGDDDALAEIYRVISQHIVDQYAG